MMMSGSKCSTENFKRVRSVKTNYVVFLLRVK